MREDDVGHSESRDEDEDDQNWKVLFHPDSQAEVIAPANFDSLPADGAPPLKLHPADEASGDRA
jgi:hypothetical protein